MYELEDILDIRSHALMSGTILTLITFKDGYQYCSCCDDQPVDYFPEYDEALNV